MFLFLVSQLKCLADSAAETMEKNVRIKHKKNNNILYIIDKLEVVNLKIT